MKKKIAILTQPLITNYGGILQAFALQKTLRDRLGCQNVVTINRKKNKRFLPKPSMSYIKEFILQFIPGRGYVRLSKTDLSIVSKYSNEFIEKYINLTDEIDSNQNMKMHMKEKQYDIIIVGSDQVWRPKYSPNIYEYFLDLPINQETTQKISYAASFGTSDWEYTEKQTSRVKELISNFDAISVREDTAVSTCHKQFKIKTRLTLDPTLLLEKEDYIILFDDTRFSEKEKKLYTYILDRTSEKVEVINKVSQHRGIEEFNCQPTEDCYSSKEYNLDNYIYPPVVDWIKGFYYSDFVITDSFHGVVFSIIFNKNFIAIANKNRGISRFTSILSLFGLGERLIYSINDLSEELINSEIDFSDVNIIKKNLKKRSLNFIRENVQ